MLKELLKNDLVCYALSILVFCLLWLVARLLPSKLMDDYNPDSVEQ